MVLFYLFSQYFFLRPCVLFRNHEFHSIFFTPLHHRLHYPPPVPPCFVISVGVVQSAGKGGVRYLFSAFPHITKPGKYFFGIHPHFLFSFAHQQKMKMQMFIFVFKPDYVCMCIFFWDRKAITPPLSNNLAGARLSGPFFWVPWLGWVPGGGVGGFLGWGLNHQVSPFFLQVRRNNPVFEIFAKTPEVRGFCASFIAPLEEGVLGKLGPAQCCIFGGWSLQRPFANFAQFATNRNSHPPTCPAS